MARPAADVLPIELWTLVLLQLARVDSELARSHISRSESSPALDRAAHVCRAFNALCMDICVKGRDWEPDFWYNFSLSSDRKSAQMDLHGRPDIEILRMWLYPPRFESLSVTFFRSSSTRAQAEMLLIFISRCSHLRTLRVDFNGCDVMSRCDAYWYDNGSWEDLRFRRAGLSACCAIASGVTRVAGDGTARVLVLTGTANGTLMCSPSELEHWRLDLYHFLPPPPGLFRKRKDNSPKRSPTQINTLIWPRTPTKDASGTTRQVLALFELRAMDLCVVDDDPASGPFTLLQFDATRIAKLDLGSPERGIAPLYYPALLPRLGLPALKVLSVRRGDIPAEILHAFLVQHATLEEFHLHKSSPQHTSTPLLNTPLALPFFEKVDDARWLLRSQLYSAPAACQCVRTIRFTGLSSDTLMKQLIPWLFALPRLDGFEYETDARAYLRLSRRLRAKVETWNTARINPYIQPWLDASWARKRGQAYIAGEGDSFPEKCPPNQLYLQL
ncbi:hypothetical protein MKEN_01154000 [Mycena kentingensis (nom. inval.)]|nr:hypothetical protein MKEN_01154000 [Mycena kentingensis (nom. inval.)]